MRDKDEIDAIAKTGELGFGFGFEVSGGERIRRSFLASLSSRLKS